MKNKYPAKRLFIISTAALLFILALAPASYGQECNALPNIKIKNTARDIGNGLYECIVYVEADKSTLGNIEEVKYTLHPSLPHPKQKIKTTRDRRYPFGSNTFTASEEFYINVKIEYRKGKDTYCTYRLKLFGDNQP